MTQPILHDLQRNLANAGDAQIARIVAMVDAMPQRGEADALIAPLRPRLVQLRPPRPFGFTRLLFTPIDPLVVPPSQWRQGGLTVPRSALAPIAAALRTARPGLADQADSATAALTSEDGAAIAALGATLWPEAAAALGHLKPPADWVATGLPDTGYAAIAGTIAAVLHVAPEIHALAASHEAASEDAVRRVLGRTAPRGPQALSTVVAVLLARLPDPGHLVALAAEASGISPPHATDRAVDHTLDRMQAAVGQGDPAHAAQQASRIRTLLAGLEASATTRPERKRRIDLIRRDAEALHRLSMDAGQPRAEALGPSIHGSRARLSRGCTGHVQAHHDA